MPESHAIVTAKLSRSFGDLTAVDNLDLVVDRGSFFGFLGPNGAGKSTTLKMLTGLLRPTSGEARVLGFDLSSNAVEVKRRIGVVPEQLALFDRLTAQEYLRFVGRMHDLSSEVVRSRSDELLTLLGLDEVGGKLIVDFSHGMKKKLAFAAALIHQPELLFLDEPFEGIDAVASGLIKSILNQLISKQVTIFLTSHILEIVEKLCSRIAIVNNGRLVASGTLAELRCGLHLEGRDAREEVSLEELFIRTVGGEHEQPPRLSWLE